MKKFILPMTVFVVTCAASAFLGWLAGYDFDYRSWVVSAWAFATFVIAFILILIVEFIAFMRKVHGF